VSGQEKTLVVAWASSNKKCDHDWEYAGSAWQQPAEDYPDAQCDFTGFLEHCTRCGELWQVPA
jgi:hypothetical protein